ncbi:Ger(x)C family spore germination protein [Filobacillus milosensis]|uniref:Ger(X)C family spore germination protein n=1 Tax=Filobacillus milosensis TaxID=94137 RepID=A0A4Y8IRS3_9BACI|nr:Ger(x)C family spore germination protein [Filobacillus milosensis]TFB21120.1 Ger(x)C family spore germination protein [Filobacillus milosensis]
MKKIIVKLLTFIIILSMLTGCWDERPFKNAKIIVGVSFDQGKNENIESTVLIPTVQGGGIHSETEKLQTVTTEANTPLDVRNHLDIMVSNSIDPSKLQVILLGEELAKKDIYPILDVFYRNAYNNLNAMIAITEGSATEVINTQPANEANQSKYLVGIINAATNTTLYSGENLQMICAELFEPGEDFVLPYLSKSDENNSVRFSGLALFHDKNFTGEVIRHEDAVLLTLMDGHKGKQSRITRQIPKKKDYDVYNYVTIDVLKNKKDIKYQLDQNKITIDLNFSVRILEYPPNQLKEIKNIKELTKTLEEELTKEATSIIKKLQEANSDILSLGRKAQAYHYNEWKQMNWEKDYKNLEIIPNVKVTIKDIGIID